MKALVTGGGGFLGGAIVRKLVERGDTVRNFSRGNYPELEKLGVEQHRGDISDPEAVGKACAGIDIVFHVAAKAGVWGVYDDYYRANTLGTKNVIKACFANEISTLVYTSSPSVIFDGTDMEDVDESAPYPEHYHAYYPQTKALAEKIVVKAAEDGLKTVSLRPHLIWGPGDTNFAPRILSRAKKLRIVGNGRNRVDTIYIDNAAMAHLLAADRLRESDEISGRIYFISQDDPINLWEMINAILHAGGKPPVTRSISQKSARRIGALLEFGYRTFRLPGEPKMTKFLAAELGTSHWFNISAAKNDFGYKPAISTEDGMKELSQWLSEEFEL
ncbi:MAG: NAD-dependent epimerase/dehydratase family protein [Desulfobacterales bacterium]|nr:NAD-dependent epimerase/dehydratase family protein [Desulfobacterales bacterium]